MTSIHPNGVQFRGRTAVYPRIVEDTQEMQDEVAVKIGGEPVFRWRLERLEQAGYDPCSALELARRHDIDLHIALDLRKRGCPADTAVRILN